MLFPSMLLVLTLSAQAEAPSAVGPRECIQKLSSRADALAAKDWASLDRLSRGYLEECQGLFGPEDVARPYVDLSVAAYELGRLEESLEAAEQCGLAFSAEPYCPLYKARALMGLGRRDEGHRALESADDLIRAQSEEVRQQLKKTKGSERRDLESRQASLDGASRYLQRLRRESPRRSPLRHPSGSAGRGPRPRGLPRGRASRSGCRC